MIRLGYIGVPGAGKTTTARALAGAIRSRTKFKRIELVSEYARQYIQKYGIDSPYDQIRIFRKQLAEEENFKNADVIITDSPIFLGLGYAIEMRELGNQKHTMVINDLFKDMNKLNELPRYDIIFHLPPILKPVEDGVRPPHQFDSEWRNSADIRLRAMFEIFKPKHMVTLKGITVEERVDESVEYILNHL